MNVAGHQVAVGIGEQVGQLAGDVAFGDDLEVVADRVDGGGVAGPDADLVALAGEAEGEGGAEGAGAEDRDAHALAPFLPEPRSGAAARSSGQRGRAESAMSEVSPSARSSPPA